MNTLIEIFQNTNLPFVSAFILGIMTAISPCPLATNITATAFISRDISKRTQVFYQGLMYTLGRIISYTGLGIIIYLGSNTFNISSFFQQQGERILGPLLIVVSLFMLNIIPVKFSLRNGLSERFEKKSHFSLIQSMLLGIIFALAFCPVSGVFYFGMLIPMTISSVNGLYLPIIFAIATALPVIVMAYLLAFTISGIGKMYNKIRVFELWFRRVVALLFLIVGIYFTIIFFI